MNARVRSIPTYSARGFVEQNRKAYGQIWNALGRTWSADLATEAAWASNNILTGDHGHLKSGTRLNSHKHLILPWLSRTGLFDGLTLQPAHQQRFALVLPGAKWTAMARRAQNAARLLSSDQHGFKNVVGLFGQRPRTDKLDGTIEEIYGSLPSWTQRHPWVVAQMELGNTSGVYEPWQGPFATEWELGVLAFIAAFDNGIEVGMPVTHTPLRLIHDGVPLHRIAHCELYPVGYDSTRFTALNAPAVHRDFGDPRPTTTSTTHYMLDHLQGRITRGDELVVASIRVHWYRILSEIERIVHQRLPDVTVTGMAEAVAPEQQEKFFAQAMGELIRILNEAAKSSERLPSPTG